MKGKFTRNKISLIPVVYIFGIAWILTASIANARTDQTSGDYDPNYEAQYPLTTNYFGGVTLSASNSNIITRLLDSDHYEITPTSPGIWQNRGVGTYTACFYNPTATKLTSCVAIRKYPFDDGTPTGTISPNGWMQSGDQTITWSASETGTDMSGLKTVTLSYLNGGVWGKLVDKSYSSLTISDSGAFSISTSVSRIYQYKYDLTDKVSHSQTLSGDANNMNVKIDLVNPVLVDITNPATGQIINLPQVTINGRATDDISGIKNIKIKLNGNDCTSLPQSGQLDTSECVLGTKNLYYANADNKIKEGSNTITCQAEDMSGRLSNTISKIIVYDPPKFTQTAISSDKSELGIPAIQYLGEAIVFTYKTNMDCKIRVSICKNVDGTEVVGEYHNVTCTANDFNTAVFYGGVLNYSTWKIVSDNQRYRYYIKAELLDFGGFEFDPKPPSFISPINLSWIKSHDVVTIKTNTNPTAVNPNYAITISDADVQFIKQNEPLSGMIIAQGRSTYPGPNYYDLPKTKSGADPYCVVTVKKPGYPFTQIQNINTMNNSNIECLGFIPYMPGDLKYTNVVGSADYADTDADGITDGWEYKYWSQWQGWIQAFGCDLSNSGDSSCDADQLYSQPERRTASTQPGDGLTNLQEYELSKNRTTDLDPRYIDLIVQLDWITSSFKSYIPSTITTQTCSTVLLDAGVKVHWAPQGQAIGNLDAALTRGSTVNIADLNSILTSNLGHYSISTPDSNINLVHAVFAPGWTVINGISNTTNAMGAGGLYIGTPNNTTAPRGVFVFDLHSRNLDPPDPLAIPVTNSTNSDLLDTYEGYILAHEIGHALNLPDVGY